MSAMGQGLPSRLRWDHDRCTPDSCRLCSHGKADEAARGSRLAGVRQSSEFPPLRAPVKQAAGPVARRTFADIEQIACFGLGWGRSGKFAGPLI